MSVSGTPISIADVPSDSPLINAQLKSGASQLYPTKKALDRLIRDVGLYHSTGNAHLGATSRMVESLRAASNYFGVPGLKTPTSSNDSPMADVADVIERAAQHQKMLLAHTKQMLLKETQKLADEIGEAIETHAKLLEYNIARQSAMTKFTQSSPGMVTLDGADEEYHKRAEKAFGTRRVYQEMACDMVLELNRLDTSAKYRFIKTVTDQLSAFHGYYQQGAQAFAEMSTYSKELFEMVQSLERAAQALIDDQISRRVLTISEIQRIYSLDMKGLPASKMSTTLHTGEEKGFSATMKRLRQKAKDTVNDFSDKHKQALKPPPAPDDTVNLEEAIKNMSTSGKKQGWVLRRHTKSLLPSWKPEYLALHGSSLVSIDSAGDAHEVCPLQLTNVKPVQSATVDRLHCIQIAMPTSKIIVQAQGERDAKEWRQAIEYEISRTIHGSSHNGVSLLRKDIPDGELDNIEGNNQCADCHSPDVSWASVNLGILLCIRCSGAHRSLGVDVSKVRSTKLDDWTAEMIEHMKSVGNAKANLYFEARLDEFEADKRPSLDSSQDELYSWASAKYVDRKYVPVDDALEDSDIPSHNASMVSVVLEDTSDGLESVPISPMKLSPVSDEHEVKEESEEMLQRL